MKFNKKLTSLLLIVLLCSQLILTALSSRKSLKKGFTSYTSKKLTRNSAHQDTEFYFNLVSTLPEDDCAYTFEEWKQAILDEKIDSKGDIYGDVEYGDNEELINDWLGWCRSRKVDKEVLANLDRSKFLKADATLESICAFGILEQLPHKFCWKSPKKTCNPNFYEKCGPIACVKKNSNTCFSVIFFEMILGTLANIFNSVTKVITGLDVIDHIKNLLKSVIYGAQIQEFIAFQKGNVKEINEFLQLDASTAAQSDRKKFLIKNMVSSAIQKSNKAFATSRIERVCEDVYDGFVKEAKETQNNLGSQESGFINYIKKKFMNFEDRIRRTLENVILKRRLSKTLCSSLDYKCFQSIVGVIGLIDPSGLVSFASPFIRPFCQDQLLMKRRFK